MRQGYVDHLGTPLAQPLCPAPPQRIDFLGHFIDAVFLRYSNLQSLDRAAEHRLVVGNRQIDRGGILGIVARHRPQQYRGIANIAKNLDRELEKNKITEAQKSEALKRIEVTLDRAQLSVCDFIVEAASEKLEIKAELFRDFDRICRPEVTLASNTSSISITKLGAVTQRPQKVIGMHFFNPVPVMKLVEVVRGMATSDETFQAVRELAMKLEKTPVEVNDAPGFVSNRVLMPLLNEAMYAVMEGVATPEAVDEVFKLGMNHPMGPLTLADFIGLDVCLDIMRVMHNGLGDPKYRPCPLLVKMVDAGWLGRKSGHGFYKYQ